MTIRKSLHWPILFLFVLACARQTTPTGGPRDSIPPKLIVAQSFPRNGQTNFNSQQIELAFDETIFLNNPKEQIIITPDVRKEYDIISKKNRVILKLNSPLQDTTTYAINFREAIQDITEKNSPPELKLAFSTGPYIDSLSISGSVIDPLTSKEIKDATVAIYHQDTFNIFDDKPVYFGRSNEKGIYSIDNLKPGNYNIYAFNDQNKNLIVDSKSESYGFISQPTQLNINIKSVTIPMIRLDARPLKLTSARPTGTYFTIKTSKNLKTYSIKSDEQTPLYSSYGEDHANVRIYNTIDQDSIPIHFTALDSINNPLDTTLYLKFSQRATRPESFKASASSFQVLAHKGTIHGTIQFTKPLAQINYDSILYRIDSLNVVKIQAEDIHIDSSINLLTIHKAFDKTLLAEKPESKEQQVRERKPKDKSQPQPIRNQLYIAPASFISIESDTSVRITQSISPATLASTGIIFVEIQTNEPNYILQLLNRQNEIISVKNNTPSVSFEDLTPGDYQLRLIIDKDANQAWTPGNFFLKQEPEPIVFYKNEKGQQSVSLKANWELGPLLIKF